MTPQKDGYRYVQAANEAPDLLKGCGTPLEFSLKGLEFTIDVYSLQALPPHLLDWAFNLVKTNLHDQYVAAKDTGWSDAEKRREMTEENPFYLIVREKKENGEKRPLAGFLYFQFVMEDCSDWENTDEGGSAGRDNGVTEDTDGNQVESDEGEKIPVIYCYELQLESPYRRMGLGTHLMSIMEELGKKYKMQKAMLTVFKSNSDAIGFYTKLGYGIDSISPSNHLSPRRAARISYEIFSKRL